MRSDSFLDCYDRDFAPKLGPRAATFRAVFAELIALKRPVTIVETGCVREIGNWFDGQSTLLFDKFTEHVGGHVCAVDLNPESVRVAQAAVGAQTTVHYGDSVLFLSRFDRPIDFLYLDSLDWDDRDPQTSAMHHFCELCAANRHLSRGAIVMTDDTAIKWPPLAYGKGMLVATYMQRIGADVFCHGGAQVAWKMPN